MDELERDLCSRRATSPALGPDAAPHHDARRRSLANCRREDLVEVVQGLEALVEELHERAKDESARLLLAADYLESYGPLPHRRGCPGRRRGEEGCRCGASHVERLLKETRE